MDRLSAKSANRRALIAFAERLRRDLAAEQVLLFGSHARGDARPDSDYDLIVVAAGFAGIPRLRRALGLRDLFYEVGGCAPLDLICLTPEEFEQARQSISLVAAVAADAIDLLLEPTPAPS